jgi:hypothetical protein
MRNFTARRFKTWLRTSTHQPQPHVCGTSFAAYVRHITGFPYVIPGGGFISTPAGTTKTPKWAVRSMAQEGA